MGCNYVFVVESRGVLETISCIKEKAINLVKEILLSSFSDTYCSSMLAILEKRVEEK